MTTQTKTTSLTGFQYKEKLGLTLAILLGALFAICAFIGTMYLGYSTATSLEVAGVALSVGIAVGAAMGASYYPNPQAIGTMAMAMSKSPTKVTNDLESAAVVIQQASVAMKNIKDSLAPQSAAQQVDFGALAEELSAAQTAAFMPVLQKYFSGIAVATPQAKPA
jgi:hypothetical protein